MNGDAKGITDFRITRARDWSKAAGIMTWGHFIIDLPGERIEHWACRVFREWALCPGPLWTFLKSMNNWPALKSAVSAGWHALGWMR